MSRGQSQPAEGGVGATGAREPGQVDPVDRELPFTEHIEELRQRLRRSLVSILLAFLVTVGFRERIFQVLEQPMARAIGLLHRYHPDSPVIQATMHFKDPIEPFFTYLKVALVAGLFLAIPYILYQVWKFVAPGLYQHERRATLPFVVSSTVMFLAGAAFCHQIVLPMGYYALLSYAGPGVSPMFMMKEYASITIKLLLAFGLIFETPVFIVFLSRIGIIGPATLRRNRRWALVVIFTVAALLTPPDVVTQLMLGVPLYLLFELSIVAAALLGRTPGRRRDP